MAGAETKIVSKRNADCQNGSSPVRQGTLTNLRRLQRGERPQNSETKKSASP